MFSNLFIFLVLSLLLSTVSVSAGGIRQRRATPVPFNPNRVIVNMVSDPVAGGPMEMGWLQVPHIDSPMYAPVEEKKA